MAQTNPGYTDAIYRSTSGYVFNGPCGLTGVITCTGSTSGLWTFRNGSTTGAVRFEIGTTASSPSKRNSASFVLGTVTFSSKCYVSKTGANKGAILVRYFS
mgnify:CR=1 FL=1